MRSSSDYLRHVRYDAGASVTPYEFKTKPWPHQERIFDDSRDKPVAALFLEQRCGKTKIIMDTVGYQFEQGNINAVLVVAFPNGVHRVWADEAQVHLPDRIKRKVVVWRSNKAGQVGFNRELQALMTFDGCAFLCVNAEALISPLCRAAIGKFLLKRKVMAVADESSFMATPGARRTKVMLNIAKHAPYRRILDGTPIAEGPLDIYTQMAFLDKTILGQDSFWAFKHRYAKWQTGFNGRTNQEFEQLVEYQNIDELQARLAPYSYRITRAEAFKGMPPKVYQKRYFQLGDEAQKAYNRLRDEYVIDLHQSQVTVNMAMTRMMRLQQVASGYWPEHKGSAICAKCDGAGCPACDDLGAIETVAPLQLLGHNARLDALKIELEQANGPVVVLARFRHDIDDIITVAQSLGLTTARYDGTANDEAKAFARAAFQKGAIGVLAANPLSASRGIRLDRAQALIYYSNSFSLTQRLQSEDRAESGERTESTQIIDLVAEGTVDEDIVASLRAKKRLQDYVMQDKAGAWL